MANRSERSTSATRPFPYTAGLFWGVSYELVRWMDGLNALAGSLLSPHAPRLTRPTTSRTTQVRWMAGSRLVYDFTHNASARFRPPYWVSRDGARSSFGSPRSTPHAALPQPRRAMRPQLCHSL